MKSKGKIVKIARKKKIINFKGATVRPIAHFWEENNGLQKTVGFILTGWKNMTAKLKFHKCNKNSHEKLMWNKDILKQTELERINHQYSNLKINTKSISTGRKRMLPEMQEEIESDRKGEYVLKLKYIKNIKWVDGWIESE